MTDQIKRQDLSGIALSAFQRESIFNALRSLEENLWHLDSLLIGHEEDRILHRRKLDLTVDQRTVARGVIATTLYQIGELAEILQLETREENPACSVSVQLNHHWYSIKNRRSDRLSLFGDIEPAQAELLDQHLERLALLSAGLAKLILPG